MTKNKLILTLRGRSTKVAWALLALCAVAAPTVAQTYITPTTASWSFVEETATGSGAFVLGPGITPSGSPGSVQLTVGNPGGELLFTQQYAGTRLSNVAGLSYSTYVVSSALPVTATMQFDFDNDLTSPTASYGGRAVFDPALLGAVVTPGVWQTWDPMTQKAWWGSGTPGTRPLNMVCTQAAPCTFAQILAAFPNGGVLSDLFAGAFGFKLGNGGGPSQVSVDSFTVGTAGLSGPIKRFDFAPAAPPPPLPVVATAVPTLGGEGLLVLVILAGLAAARALRRAQPSPSVIQSGKNRR